MNDDVNKDLKRIRITRRILLALIFVYIAFFIVINSEALTPDNVKRLIFDARNIMSGAEMETETYVDTSFDRFSVKLFKDGFVTLTNGKLTVYNSHMQVYSSHSVALSNPVLRVSDNYILCFDRGGKHLYIADSFNIVFEYEYEKGIINAVVDNDGVLAVAVNGENDKDTTAVSKSKGVVLVYNKDHEYSFGWWSSEGYIEDVLLNAKNIVSVVTLESDNENADTVLRVFNYKTASENEPLRVDDRIALITRAKADGSVEMFTPYDIVSLKDGEYSVIRDISSEKVLKVASCGEYSMTASVKDESRKIYLVSAFDSAGNLCFSETYPYVSAIACGNGSFYVETEHRILCLNDKGEIISEILSDTVMTEILPGSGYTLAVGVNKISKLHFVFEND